MNPITTLDDGTRVLKTTGDQQALEHGGGVVYRDGGGVFWSWWDPPDPGTKNYIVYTVALTRGFLQDLELDVEEIALASCGEISKKELIQLSRSKVFSDRLIAMEAARDAFGSSGICPKPDEVTPYEMALRWGEIFGVDHEEVAMLDHEDYLIRETPRGIECGQIGGRMLGRFDDYQYALRAVADDIARSASHAANLYHEHAAGKLELVVWDREKHQGRHWPKKSVLPQAIWQNEMRRYRKSLSGGRCKSKGIIKMRKQVARKKRAERMRQSARNVRQILEARE